MNNVECESCVKRKTMYCPNSFKCYATKDKPYWQNRIMLLEENQQLHNKIDKAIDIIEKSVTSDIGINSKGQIVKYHQLTEDETGELLEILKGDVDG